MEARLGDYLWELIVDYLQEEDAPEVATRIIELFEDINPDLLSECEDIFDATSGLQTVEFELDEGDDTDA